MKARIQKTAKQRINYIILSILFVVAMMVVAKGCSSVKTLVQTEVEQQIDDARSRQASVISEADIAGFPEPVQRYLRYAGVVGKPHIRFVRLKYEGFFRRSANERWAPLQAEQTYTTVPPSFVFHAGMKSSFFVRATVREKYMDGKGSLLLKIWPGFTVANANGATTDIDQADRYLNEMVFFPTAYVKPYNQWEAIDKNSAKVSLSYQGVTISAVAYFNEQGEMVKFVGQKHIGTDGTMSGTERMLAKWTVNLREYEERHGFRVPTRGEAIFHLDSGDFEYIRVTGVPELEYDTFAQE
jgi:hypothetical protein